MDRFYRRNLPHWREEHGTPAYFVTWRLARGQAALTDGERDVVADALRHFDGRRYQLIGFVVMDDHVHVVVVPRAGERLERLLHSWKSFTSHRFCRHGERRPPMWQDEYFDRLLRTDGELDEKLEYITGNPWKRWSNLKAYRWVWPPAVAR
ncbi:MAG TPA: transposase [Vicinamibacterales bacterium]